MYLLSRYMARQSHGLAGAVIIMHIPRLLADSMYRQVPTGNSTVPTCSYMYVL